MGETAITTNDDDESMRRGRSCDGGGSSRCCCRRTRRRSAAATVTVSFFMMLILLLVFASHQQQPTTSQQQSSYTTASLSAVASAEHPHHHPQQQHRHPALKYVIRGASIDDLMEANDLPPPTPPPPVTRAASSVVAASTLLPLWTTTTPTSQPKILFKSMQGTSIIGNNYWLTNATTTTPTSVLTTAVATASAATAVGELLKQQEPQFGHVATSSSCQYGDICLLHCYSDFNDIHGVDSIIDMAVDWINEQTNLLPHHRLAAQHLPTMYYETRNIGKTTFALTKAVTDGLPKALVIGPTFSREATVLAQLAPLYNLMLISYSAGSSELSDATLFPYFVRTATSQERLVPFAYRIFKHFNYTACYILYETNSYNANFATAFENLVMTGGGAGAGGGQNVNKTDRVIGREGFSTTADIDLILTKLKSRSIRVIIVSFQGMGSLPGYLFCEAKRRGITTQQYMFIVDAAVDSWHDVKEDAAAIGCNQTELNEALEGVVQVGVAKRLPLPILKKFRNAEGNLVIGMTMDELEIRKQKLETEMGYNSSNGIEIGFWQQAYEAVVAASLGINATMSQHAGSDMMNFSNPRTFQSEPFMQALYASIKSVKLIGFTGPMLFEKNGDRIVTFVLDQIRLQTLGKVESVAYLVAGDAEMTWYKNTTFPTPNGRAPETFAPDDHIMTSYVLPYTITAVACLVLALVLGVTIIIQRRLRIKLLKELYSMQWKIDSADLVDDEHCLGGGSSKFTPLPNTSSSSSAIANSKKLLSAPPPLTVPSRLPPLATAKVGGGGIDERDAEWRKSVTSMASISMPLAELEAARQRALHQQQQQQQHHVQEEEKEAPDDDEPRDDSGAPPPFSRTARAAALHRGKRVYAMNKAITSSTTTTGTTTTTNTTTATINNTSPNENEAEAVSGHGYSSDSGAHESDDFSENNKVELQQQPPQQNLKSSELHSPRAALPVFRSTRVTTYKGAAVQLVNLSRSVSQHINQREQLMEIKAAKDVIHANCCKFIGIVLEPYVRALCFEYPHKGALQDLLLTETFDLDWDFKVSLIKDVVEGLYFIHNNIVVVNAVVTTSTKKKSAHATNSATSDSMATKLHGRLSAKYICLVDDHFVCKLTNFGVPSFTRAEQRHTLTCFAETKLSPLNNQHLHHQDLDAFMWRSPEFLATMALTTATNAIEINNADTSAAAPPPAVNHIPSSSSFDHGGGNGHHHGTSSVVESIHYMHHHASPAAKAWRRLRTVAMVANGGAGSSPSKFSTVDNSPHSQQQQQQQQQLHKASHLLKSTSSESIVVDPPPPQAPPAPRTTRFASIFNPASIFFSTSKEQLDVAAAAAGTATTITNTNTNTNTEPTTAEKPIKQKKIKSISTAGGGAGLVMTPMFQPEEPLSTPGFNYTTKTSQSFQFDTTPTSPNKQQNFCIKDRGEWRHQRRNHRPRRSSTVDELAMAPTRHRLQHHQRHQPRHEHQHQLQHQHQTPTSIPTLSLRVATETAAIASNIADASSSIDHLDNIASASPSLSYQHFSTADDVYALGLIITQVMNRCVPYNVKDDYGKLQILLRVRSGALADLIPMLTANDRAPSELVDMAYKCLNKAPDARPRIGEVRDVIHRIIRQEGYASNMMENLLARMDTYAKNLESLVRERTEAFFEEKKRSEALLHSILPRSVADQLKAGKNVDPESYDAVTIYFSDIVGFTTISAESTPLQVVTLLNELYTLFDNILHQYDAFKVETIGDAYMVVSGLPVRNGNEHARQIALFSLHLLYRIHSFKIAHLLSSTPSGDSTTDNATLKLRIGLHTGPCCAGVVGFVCPRYCLFGDTVNTASRMESTGEPLRIHCSDSLKAALDKFGHFRFAPRGRITVKGKGDMTTYWLVGDNRANNFNQPSRLRGSSEFHI